MALNYVLRVGSIAIIEWVGYPTQSQKIVAVTMITFYVYFSNTAILLLVVNANMQEQPITFGLNGTMSDFNSDWFRTTGNLLVSTMLFNVYYPLILYVLYWVMRFIPRLIDTSGTMNKNKTKSTSIQGYIDIWQGPDFMPHYKYSGVLNIVFVTFMFGFGMPILFPVAAVSLWILYVGEKWALFYSYNEPPNYDETLSNAVIQKLKWAPILYLAFGYWMASSKQLFSNDFLAPI